ncbi:ADP-ribosylglycohydrolase family protein [Marinobacter confluentis]|uniref:ADP-ribosylglycohydrolase family protein n=1 Tax=Marinobacter confluentis TaxID=1697557 RepID=A0A4Z1BYA9_9GAMM|nr:ADP-ribosylglycohydrolase family protein [Marinobacter confluentis]TGN39510.1 ADP-ribosylglycohydrolase family protein [Marinobacter confluentis]
MSQSPDRQLRATSALKTQFIADALAMPVHWYYNPMDIERAFPGGLQGFEAAPEFHPSSIMSLHSTSSGGRRSASAPAPEVVGNVILKGRAGYWNRPNVHYHQGMKAGENTLNAQCARVLMRTLADNHGHYDPKAFLEAYIGFMTADPPAHADTYAESYHRGFFANYQRGLPPEQCAMVTHDTPSVGGLVTVAPLALSQRLKGETVADIQAVCRNHVALTHPDETLLKVCDRYVALLCALMEGPDDDEVRSLLAEAGRGVPGQDVEALVKRNLPDLQVVGRVYSPACYISDSWPAVLYLAYKYRQDPWMALRVNTALGGDNVHRGAVLGAILGLLDGGVATRWFNQLVAHRELDREMTALVSAAAAPR